MNTVFTFLIVGVVMVGVYVAGYVRGQNAADQEFQEVMEIHNAFESHYPKSVRDLTLSELQEAEDLLTVARDQLHSRTVEVLEDLRNEDDHDGH